MDAKTILIFGLLVICLMNLKSVNCDNKALKIKKVEGLVLRMVWKNILPNYNKETKTMILKKIRKLPDYRKLVENLTTLTEARAKKIVALLGEIMKVYLEK